MRAVVFKGKDFPLTITDFPKPKPGKDQMLVKLKNAAINHRDLWTTLEQASVPHATGGVLGSDGGGSVEEVGADVDTHGVGAEGSVLRGCDGGRNP
ncbi:MAG: alcohol dehydrogenase catalytic domain-containing protein, partial [Flammeovirgaceae bacterium]